MLDFSNSVAYIIGVARDSNSKARTLLVATLNFKG